MQTIFKALTLFIFLLPVVLMAEIPSANNVANCNPENCKLTSADSIEPLSMQEAEPVPAQQTEKLSGTPNNNPNQKGPPYDWRKDGIFKGLFHAGVNFAQIDGDAYSGYTTVGFDGGVGVMVRFHKYFSTSMELNYTMWGAQAAFVDPASDLYKVRLDYVQVPLSLNIHDKEIVMFSAGINVGYLVYFNERIANGKNFTDSVQQPKKIDLDAFAAVHFIIKKQFGIGLKFSYSMLPFRGAEYPTLTRIQGEYNNVITIRFMYILKAWKKK